MRKQLAENDEFTLGMIEFAFTSQQDNILILYFLFKRNVFVKTSPLNGLR
jgi:hypothetical protein